MGIFDIFKGEGKKQEMTEKSSEGEKRIRSRADLAAKVEKLKLRKEVSAQQADQLMVTPSTDPEALKDAVTTANRDGHNFVLAETYLHLGDASNTMRNSAENGPDIRAVSNPAGYETLADEERLAA